MTTDAGADWAADAAASVDVPGVDLAGALRERVVPAIDRVVVEYKKAHGGEEETDPEKMGVVVTEAMAGGAERLLAMKRADFFLCKTQAFAPPGAYAKLVKFLTGQAGGFTAQDEPPMPEKDTTSRTEFDKDDTQRGGGGAAAGGKKLSFAERIKAARRDGDGGGEDGGD